MSEWISVEDRLPDKDLTAAVVDDKGAYHIAMWFRDQWRGVSTPVMLWMPLPEPPKD